MTETTHNKAAPEGPVGDDYVFEAAASFAQQRLWFLDQLEPGSPVYNISFALRLHGSPDAEALQTAIDRLVTRHESLRTTFDSTGSDVVQVIAESAQIELQREKATTDTDARLTELAGLPFDLRKGPLLRACLLDCGADQYVLLLVIHHIIADAWSLDVLYRELAACYAAALDGSEADLPELTVQYADYAEWQQEWLSGEELRKQLGYWRTHLAGAPELLELPLDRPRPRLQTHNGATLERRLPAALAGELKQLAQGAAVTRFVLYMAAFAVLLSRYAGSDDLVIGTPIAGRKRRELEGLIGFFVNTLGLRIELGGDPDFMTLLERAKQASLGAYAHQDLPFEKLVEELQPARSTSYSPLFQVMFVLHHAVGDNLPLANLETSGMLLDSGTAKFDLTLFVTELNDGTSLLFEYNTDLFDAGTIERMLEHFVTLLGAIAAAPRQPLSRLRLLSDAQREATLRSINATAREFPARRVHELVQAQVARTPDAPAVEHHDEVLSYAELNARANRLARQLQSLGAGPDRLVALCMERGIDMAVSVLATLKAGAAYVPVDPHYPPERIRTMLADCEATVIVTQPGTAGIPAGNGSILYTTAFASQGDADDLPAAGDSVYVIYTSGSTGTPKGVELTHAGLSNLIRWQQQQPGLDMPARTLQFASLSFDVSFQEMFSTWAQGGCLVLIDENLRRDMPALARLAVERGIERLFLPFAALQPLADEFLAAATLPPLRDVIVAGEQLQVTPAVRALFRALDNARLHNHYGPSETHVTTAFTMSGSPDVWPALPPIGLPVANTQVYVLDATLEPVPPGLPGELWIGGVQVGRGYLHRPELTAERFREDPFAALMGMPQNRLYRTGDRVRQKPDGNLEYLGRTDEQVKWRGFRIEPGEIEAALMLHPAIGQAVVMLREDQPGDRRLVAYLIADAEAPEPSAMRDWLRERLPDHMVPSVFVTLDALPLTPSGKLARRALPVPDYEGTAGEYTPPRNDTERALAEIWADVLGVTRAGIHDDFFELGGHSLLATQIVSRVRDTLGAEVPLLTLFECPTVARFAERLPANAGVGSSAAVTPRTSGGPAPLSFSQQRLWFLEQLEPGNPAYNFPVAIELRGELDEAALGKALTALIERHESLRTRFAGSGDTAVQVIDEPQPVAIAQVAGQFALDELRTKLTALSQQPFDLARGPLLRAHLLQTDRDATRVLLLVTHHIVSDGWSLNIMLEELAALYRAACQGETADLPALPVQYADYAVWQRDQLQGEPLRRQLDFWRQALAEMPPLLELPTDRPRPAEQTYRGASVVRWLDGGLQTELNTLAAAHNCTLYMVLLAAFDVLLATHGGTRELVVGTPIAGRQRTELEGLIGFLSNTLAIPARLEGDPAFSDFLRSVRTSLLDAYAHQDVPFEKLVEELQPERAMSHSPVFQVMFVLQNNPGGEPDFGGTDAGGLQGRTIGFEMGIAKFDLLLEMAESPDGLRTGLQYNADLFDAATAERLLGHFEQLLRAVVADASRPLSRLPLMGEREREQILLTFNATAVDVDPLTLNQLVELQAERTPDAIAIEMGGATCSYRELNANANRLARALRERGARPGRFVAICAGRSMATATAVLAALKTGAAYVPVDPNYPAERIAVMLEDSGACVVMTDSAAASALQDADTPVLRIDSELPATSGQNPDFHQYADGASAYVIYTSGSTGRPKGVELTHANLVNLVQWQLSQPGLDIPARTLQFASLSFDVSFQELLTTWAQGGTVVLVDEDTRRDLPALARFVAAAGIERVYLPFAALQPLADAVVADGALDFHLRDVVVAGEQLQVTPVIRKLFERLDGARLHNHYGPSETHVTTAWTGHGSPQDWPALPPIGKPVANTRVYVLDTNAEPVPVGVPGELWLGGAQVAKGYLHRPQLTAEKFVADPYSRNAADRLYRTGDRVRFLADGNLEYLGRTDDQVKWRGFRIEPGEIETALAAQADVRQAVVLIREDTPGQRRLVAYVTPAGRQPDSRALLAALRTTLPDYMVPSTIVVLDALPLTPSGKLARRALPVPEYEDAGEAYVAPRNPTEETLVRLWSDVLGVTRVGVHDDFFALGGHSLLATQLISRVRDTLGVAMPLKSLFRNPTPEALGAALNTMQMAEELQAGASDPDGDDGEEREEFEL